MSRTTLERMNNKHGDRRDLMIVTEYLKNLLRNCSREN